MNTKRISISRLSCPQRRPLLRAVALVTVWLAAPASQGALYTYHFGGKVTVVDNPDGFFTYSATVGAPVTGTFTYTDTPDQPPFSVNANFTNHTHGETPTHPNLTLRIGGAVAHSSEFSISNMIVGNDNTTDTLPPFFPVGDSFRYSDLIDGASTWLDFSQADLFHFANGSLFFIDSTGGAFDSQSLPSGLPLSFFDVRYGIINIYDDNFEETARLTFRIDSVNAVPEASAVTMIGIAVMALGVWRRVRRQNSAGSRGRPMSAISPVLLLTIVWGQPFLCAQENQPEPVIFRSPTPVRFGEFGQSVATVGTDRVLIGEWGNTVGTAYLMGADGGLLKKFPSRGEGFGWSVAAVGDDRVLIGAPNELRGTAYLMSTNGDLLATLNPPAGQGSYLGWSVAAVGDGDFLVGEITTTVAGKEVAGSARLFRSNGTLWRTFTSPTPEAFANFGWAVAALGPDRVIISARRAAGEAGAA